VPARPPKRRGPRQGDACLGPLSPRAPSGPRPADASGRGASSREAPAASSRARCGIPGDGGARGDLTDSRGGGASCQAGRMRAPGAFSTATWLDTMPYALECPMR
jgi:hypothetical protein